MKIPFVDLKLQTEKIKRDVFGRMEEVVDNCSFIQGGFLKDFEEEFSRFNGDLNCAGVSSGTSALFLALKAAGIKEGDEVITTPATFFATAEAILNLGASLKLNDIDPDTYLLKPEGLEISDNTKAVVPVHLYGQMAPMTLFKKIAEERNVVIIEDAAQAHGALYDGQAPGKVSQGASFSFYPGKNLGAWGDAGMVVSNDSSFIDFVKVLRNHGRKEKYTHDFISDNYRMDGIQSVVLSEKMKHISLWNEKRREIAQLYDEMLTELAENKGVWIKTPYVDPKALHVYHIYSIQVKNRDRIREKLSEKGIATGIHYPVPLHLQPALKFLPYEKGDFPESEKLSENELSLPIYPEMTEKQAVEVVNALKDSLFD